MALSDGKQLRIFAARDFFADFFHLAAGEINLYNTLISIDINTR